VELLKISESATKNIFGGYSSKRMKVYTLSIVQKMHQVAAVVKHSWLTNAAQGSYIVAHEALY
jgi:hypothetical protein